MSIRNFIRLGNKEHNVKYPNCQEENFKASYFLCYRDEKQSFVYMLQFNGRFSSYPKPLFQSEAK